MFRAPHDEHDITKAVPLWFLCVLCVHTRRVSMRRLPLATRMLRRNWSAGELRVLLLALVIAVASVTTVGFFADRVQAALDAQANELLGGDLALIADKPIPEERFAEA